MMWSYKFAFFISYLYLFLFIFIFIALGTWSLSFGSDAGPFGGPYFAEGGGFILFILLGSIGWSYQWSIASVGSAAVRREMMMGTLESIFQTPTSLYTVITSYTLFGMFNGTVQMLLYLAVGYAFFSVDIAGSWIYGIIILLLSVLMMFGLNLLFSGLNIHIKEIGSIVPLLQMGSLFLCEVYIPLSLLPGPMQTLAKFLPFYHAINSLRSVLALEVTFNVFLQKFLLMSCLAGGFLLAGVLFFRYAVGKAKENGNLSYY
jgi:ABC-2 type transport system permease protein